MSGHGRRLSSAEYPRPHGRAWQVRAQSTLGIDTAFPYRARVIGLLRFVGLVNAAVWLGGTFFFLLVGQPAALSPDMQNLMGAKSYPFFSVAVAQLLAGRYFHLYLACSIVALLHLMAEWLYLGKYPHRAWLALIFGLCVAGILQTYWLQPRLAEWHRIQFTRPEQREQARHAYRTWQAMSQGLNYCVLAGLFIYLWRVTNPTEPTRFLSAKLRS